MKSEGLVESIRQRLLNLSRERGVVFDNLLVQYGLERLLFRLQASGEAAAFVLKGAMLYHVWGSSTFISCCRATGSIGVCWSEVSAALLNVGRLRSPKSARPASPLNSAN